MPWEEWKDLQCLMIARVDENTCQLEGTPAQLYAPGLWSGEEARRLCDCTQRGNSPDRQQLQQCEPFDAATEASHPASVMGWGGLISSCKLQLFSVSVLPLSLQTAATQTNANEAGLNSLPRSR